MQILILGAGQVGSSVAASLAREDSNDITVVDEDAELLEQLQDQYDIRTVQGFPSHPHILEQAGAGDAELVLAVTNKDEVNLTACQICSVLFHTPKKIARIRNNAYLSEPALFAKGAMTVDRIISPEKIITEYILRLIRHPNALQVLNFADGKVQLVAVRAYQGGPLVGNPLSDLHKHIPTTPTRVAAIWRQGEPIIPKAETIIEEDDEVFFIAARGDTRSVMAELQRLDKPYKRILIAGGGSIGLRLAKSLEEDHQVKIIEANLPRANFIAEQLDEAIVLHGDTASEDLLREEEIGKIDLFCALTNDDEANILSAMLAKRLGATKVLSIINRAAYVDLVEGGGIDIALSPQQATIGSLLAHIRRGDVAAVHSLRRGAAEAMEIIAHGDPKSSAVVGKRIADIKLPLGTTIGAIVRGDQVIITHHNTIIESEDHVILFVIHKRYIKDIEKLFHVGAAFF